jgi:hypothetical protein
MKTKTIISLYFFLFPFLSAYCQSSEFYGTILDGGAYNAGRIFKTDENGNLKSIFSIPVLYEGISPTGSLLKASNGKIYGLTTSGGIYNLGVLFEWDPETGEYIKRVDFDSTYGSHPYGGLIQAADGLIYGMTADGGQYNLGVIFQYDPASFVYTRKVSFSGYKDGKHPYGALLEASNGKFYGMTNQGGEFNYGVLFEWTPDSDKIIVKANFNGAENGSLPYGSLFKADNGILYGLTYSGGINNDGVLFGFDMVNDSLIKYVDFEEESKGSNPKGALVQANNGKIYGLTSRGGKYGEECGGHGSCYRTFGVLFEWNPITKDFIKKVDLISNVNGAFPEGNLVLQDDGDLYSFTSSFYFKWNVETDKWTNIFNIDSLSQDLYISGTPLIDNGRVYGICKEFKGGSEFLFECNPVSENGKKIFMFNYPIYGLGPSIQGNSGDGKLYGITYGGGKNKTGVIFEWDLRKDRYTKKADLPEGFIRPQSLVSLNGKLYGITLFGNTLNDYGFLYEWDPATGIFSKLIEFNDSLGINPEDLTLNETGDKLLGVTSSGTFFEFDPVSLIYSKIFEVLHLNLKYVPLHEKNFYFGIAPGIIYSWNDSSGIFHGIEDFDIWGLNRSLIKAANGKFYGTGHSSIYEFYPPSGQYVSRFTFSKKYPVGELMQASNGKIYGVAHNNGQTEGYIYEWDPGTNNYSEKIHLFGFVSDRLLEVFNYNTYSSITVSSCKSYVSPSGKYTWTESGDYADTIPNSCGWDSIMQIDLHVDNVDTRVVQNGNALISADYLAGHQWIDMDNGALPEQGDTLFTFMATHNGRYAVILTQGTCVDTSSAYTVIVTGNEQFNNGNIQIYPNPNKGRFTIDLGKIYETADIALITPSGNVIREIDMKNSQKQEFIFNEAPGIYLVKITTRDGLTILKVSTE